MTTLLERVRAATGPDIALDAEIFCFVRGYTIHENTDPSEGYFAFWEGKPWNSMCHNCSRWDALTASVDAILALIERELPGWRHAYDQRYKGRCLAWVDEGGTEPSFPSLGGTPALALCAAFLAAKETTDE